MGVDELLDDDAFDPKKLFDEEQYSTLIIKRDGFDKKQNSVADILEALLDEKNTRSENEELFLRLKENNAQQMLMEAIDAADKPSEKVKLLAACWESCLDFTPHFLYFVKMACNADFNIALEALSVVESCEGDIDTVVLAEALLMVQSLEKKPHELIDDLTESIKQRIH